MDLVHHHLIFQARVSRSDLDSSAESKLRDFLYNLMYEIDMEELIPAQLKYSKNKAWTGLLGIITSHISFHYWTVEQYIQLDIYSCKSFDYQKTINFLKSFWGASEIKALFIDRGFGKDFDVKYWKE